MKCALTKFLPFILTLFVGLTLGNFQRRPNPQPRFVTGHHEARDNMQQGRTWLVIHYQPPPSFPQESESSSAPCAVRLRVRFDVDGKVLKALSEEATAPEDCVAAAALAARQIVFTPASENGKPVAVVAIVSYGFSEMRGRVMGEKGDAPYCLTRRSPMSSPVEIVSVEGATETEGWRVIYE